MNILQMYVHFRGWLASSNREIFFTDINLHQNIRYRQDSGDQKQILASFAERIGRRKVDLEGKIAWISQKKWEEEQHQAARPNAFALYLDDSGKKGKINITSPMLVDTIKKIIPISFFESTPNSVSFQEPYVHLFQYSTDIRQELASQASPSSEVFRDFYALESFLECHVGYGTVWKSLNSGNHTAVSFESLWALFRAGDLLVIQDRLGEKRFFKFTRIEEGLTETRVRQDFCTAMLVHFWYISWSPGTMRFSQETQCIKIARFAGDREVTSLPIYPLRFESEGARKSLLADLQSRGKKWSDLVSSPPSCFEYFGRAIPGEEISISVISKPVPVSRSLCDKSLLTY